MHSNPRMSLAALSELSCEVHRMRWIMWVCWGAREIIIRELKIVLLELLCRRFQRAPYKQTTEFECWGIKGFHEGGLSNLVITSFTKHNIMTKARVKRSSGLRRTRKIENWEVDHDMWQHHGISITFSW